MKTKRVIELCTILLLLVLTATGVSATVYINEFMADGVPPEPQSEWIELYNSGTAQVYLTNWRITDSEGSFTLPASVIPANGFIVLANNRTLFNSLYSTTSTVIEYGPNSTGTFSLANTNDNLILYDSVNTQIDNQNFTTPNQNISLGRNYDGGPAFVQFNTSTPGTYNNRRPIVNNTPNQTWAEDNNLTINFANYISDPDSNPLNISFSAVNNITINTNGLIATFIPDADFNGLRNIIVTASDNLSSTAGNTFQLNITPVNDAPRVNLPTTSFNEDSSTTVNLDNYTTDPDNSLAQITWTRTGGDMNVGVNINPTTHVATFNATPNYCGNTAVILRAADSNTSHTNVTANVNIACLQDAPIINLTSPLNNANLTSTSATLQWTGSDVDNNALSYEVFTGNLATNLSSYLNTTLTSTTLTGLTNGQTIFWRVVVNDTITTVNSPIYSFNVLTNNAPQITTSTPTSTLVTIVKNSTQPFNITATDADNNTLTHQWQLNGTTVSNATNYLFNSTNYATGTYQLVYTATDTFPASVNRTWNLDVRNRNAPVFSGPMPSLSINQGSSGTINLNNYFNDSDGDTLTYSALTSSSNIAVSITGNVATITPATSFFGVAGVNFTASDGLNQTQSSTIPVVINKANTAPQVDASSTPLTATIKTADNKKTTFNIIGHDSETDPLTFKWYVDNTLKQKTGHSSYNLREYPAYFVSFGYFNGQVIYGAGSNTQEVLAASQITQSLQKVGLNINNIYPISQIGSNNIILVGTPTSNSLIASLLQSDNTVLNNNEALIKTYNYNGYVALVVTGKTSNDVTAAAQRLSNFETILMGSDTERFTTGSTTSATLTTLTDSDTYDFTPQTGVYTVKVEISDGTTTTTKQWTLQTQDKPIATTFNGQTTNFNTLSQSSLASVNLVLEKTAYGKIVFDNPLDMRNVVDLDAFVNLAQGLVAVDSKNLPDLNKPATITLYNLNFNDPVIYQTGTFTANPSSVDQLCSTCNIINYTNNQLTFHVTGFSSFAIKESVKAGILLPSTIQLGSDHALRNQNVTSQFVITNPGTTDPVNNIVVSSSASSKYDIQFSTSTSYSPTLTLNLLPGESKTINLKGFIPKKEDGGQHGLGQIKASNSNYSDTASLYVYPKNSLEVVSVKVDSDTVSDGDSADVKPDTTLDVEVEVKNIGTVDFDDVTITATIYDLDDDDLEESVDFSLKDGRKAEKTLSFKIPEDLDDDDYDLKVEIEAEDDDGITHSQTLDFTLNTKKEKHKLTLDATLSSESLDCLRQPHLYTKVKNLGESDEDNVKIEITNSQLGINIIKEDIEIDENDDYSRTFTLDLEKAEAGSYTLSALVYRGTRQEDQQNFNLEIKECQKTTAATQKQKTKTIQQQHRQLITQALAQHTQPVTKVEKKSSTLHEFAVLALILSLLMTAGVVIFAVGAVIIKKKQSR